MQSLIYFLPSGLGDPSRSWVSIRTGGLALGLLAPEPSRLEVMRAFARIWEGRLFPSQSELGTRSGWGSPWRVWPQICYPLRMIAAVGLAQKLRTRDGHRTRRGILLPLEGDALGGDSQLGSVSLVGQLLELFDSSQGSLWPWSAGLRSVSQSGRSQMVWWSSGWGHWLRSVCLGVTDLGQAV